MGRKLLPLLGGVVAAVMLSGCAAVPDERPVYPSDMGCVPSYYPGYYYGPDCYPMLYGGVFIDNRFHHDHDHDFHHHHDHDFQHAQGIQKMMGQTGGHGNSFVFPHRGGGGMVRR